MFQAREPQESLWQSEFLITPRKARLMRKSWAEVFRMGKQVIESQGRKGTCGEGRSSPAGSVIPMLFEVPRFEGVEALFPAPRSRGREYHGRLSMSGAFRYTEHGPEGSLNCRLDTPDSTSQDR